MITVVGMGPGSPDYLPPVAREAVERADMLVGSAGRLALFAGHPGRKIDFHPLDKALDAIKAFAGAGNIAVLVSGDPGLYSLLPAVQRAVPGVEIKVVPGISCAQVLFARLGLDWSNVTFVSLHGRGTEPLRSLLGPGRRLCVFTDKDNGPSQIGRILGAGGLSGRAVIGEDLTGVDEKVIETDFGGLIKHEGSSACIVYLEIAQ